MVLQYMDLDVLSVALQRRSFDYANDSDPPKSSQVVKLRAVREMTTAQALAGGHAHEGAKTTVKPNR